MSLKQLQQDFVNALRNPQAAEPFIQKITSKNDLSATDRVAIYRNSMTAAMENALELSYPIIIKLVGAEFFSALARDYCRHTPSISPSLDDYGASFADFIEQQPHCKALPYLADVARLEWTWQTVIHGPDIKNALNFADLATAMAENATQITLHIPENCYLLASAYPIWQIWQLCQDDYQGEQSLDLAAGGCKILIWRRYWQVNIEPLSEMSWQILQACQDGLNLEDILKMFDEEQDSEQLNEVLTALTKQGIFVGFTLGSK